MTNKKKFKDPVMIAGEWQERQSLNNPCIGKTKADFDSIDDEHKEALKGIPRASKNDVAAAATLGEESKIKE